MTSLKPTKGKLLVAEPSILADKSFNRSVILLTAHDHEGSVGFIFNKPLDLCIKDIIPEIDSDLPIYNGGPVAKNNLYFVHNIDQLIPDSEKISDDLYWGGDFTILKQLLTDNKIKNKDIRFFLGYSGWSSKQLDDELKIDSWLVANNDHKNIFRKKYHSFWKDELMRFGGDYQLWANAPEDPSLN
ncbi:MAG: YqgE/AlgH family protein [Flavobacteriaceae bacterium]|nr:YqgE/AlgH family protein [Flavobacteriaceae bacterium]